ncbi:alpha/beta-type small acid-soluble spore protein [Ferroacidibacillus organovorans]|uniref:Spore protein n=1 Tax=Ferroacidibacillus organovorans TaxID=1765683 RepID=A0A162UF24_9BACL|nr:alpha/beta-type small acid-soluble spore protein [Ferroacidibacillus organovorans]KYP81705.1 spore protein [Ferroacidibacillus organovorans]OAG94242.1 spore protein [Ferroacidibacillus organovorans]OPG16923.1 spore protein [Ferroacidibacillus organovorans]
MASGFTQVVKGAHKALDDLKYEIAGELGLPVHQGSEDYWGNVMTRDAGTVGGHMTRKLVAFGQLALKGSQPEGK